MVIDTSSLVAIHLKEQGHVEQIEKILRAEIALVGAPTLLEAAMVLSSRSGEDMRPLLLATMRRLRIQVVSFDEDHYEAAAGAFLRYGKGRHRASLNFGDCMSYAVASLSGQPLLYNDNDFIETDIPAA